jgi:serine/threonine-protein kinase HipA
MHDNFRLSNMDYGHIMDAAFRLENSVVAYEKVLRLAAFNVFSHNRDDHSKNISFLMDRQGEWRLAPAYDLTFSHSTHGFHSMTVAGESKAPGEKELLSLAETFGVRNPRRIIEEVKTAIGQWREIAQNNGVGPATIAAIEREIN